MASATFEDHPTDPDKVILRKPRHEDDDDIQDYVRPWVGLTEDEIKECFTITPDQYLHWHIYKRIEAKLKEKNA
jgi:hypothetical protein